MLIPNTSVDGEALIALLDTATNNLYHDPINATDGEYLGSGSGWYLNSGESWGFEQPVKFTWLNLECPITAQGTTSISVIEGKTYIMGVFSLSVNGQFKQTENSCNYMSATYDLDAHKWSYTIETQ